MVSQSRDALLHCLPRSLSACWLIALALIHTPAALSAEFSGFVIGIKDGDSIAVVTQDQIKHEVRLAGIDAPEKRQPYGDAAQAHLAKLIARRLVRVIGNKRDRYGRTVAKIMLGDQDISLAQLEAGFAWHYKQYQREQSAHDVVAYALAERRAQQTNAGLWQNPDAVAPWVWRTQKRISLAD